MNSLYEAAREASKGVDWKASVQRYNSLLLFNISKTRAELLAGKDIRRGFICFDICERGKLRHIKSVHFSERVVQKSFCTNIIYPTFTRSLIYDNGASQQGKGTQFAINRLTTHLRRHFRKYGREGGILLVDFSDYFGNVAHEPLFEIYRQIFTDPRVIALGMSFISAFGDKGLGLGSETSQINAVIIVDLKHGFTFLKTHFYITETGRIIKKPCRDSITRERRKLKKQAALVASGVLTFDEVRHSYASWRGSMSHRDAYRTVQSMDRLFNRLFIDQWKGGQQP